MTAHPIKWLRHLTGGLSKLRAGARGRQARSVLAGVRSEISSVSESTEGVFLLVGGRLSELQTGARQIAAQATGITELIANDAGSLAVLDEVLTSTCSSTDAQDIAVAVAEIQKNARSIQRVIEAVRPVVRTFDMLGVVTRIESSRFNGSGVTFVSLADTVSGLSRQIREQIGLTGDSAEVLLETVSQASRQISGVVQLHNESLRPLTMETSTELQKIREHRERVGQATKVLGQRMNEVSQSVGDVVTGLQSHDIVRQQIEHVVEALGRSDSTETEIARLQAAQLRNSWTTFADSVQRIRQALTRIEHDVHEIADDAAHLLGMSEKNEATFFATLEKGLVRILEILDRNVAADEHVSKAAVAVRERLAEMEQTNAGVHSIGIEMQRIALNSTIQAAKLGSNGGALESAARAIQGLALETETASDTLAQTLDMVRKAAASLAESASLRNCSRTQISRLRESAGVLRSIHEKAREDCRLALEMSAGLKQRIRETSDGFGTQEETLHILASAAEKLEELSQKMRGSDAADMERMVSLYTMQSERAVHDDLYDSGAQNDPVPAADAPAAAEEENVEFF